MRVVLLLLLVSCASKPLPPPSHVVQDAGGPCAQACVRRAELDCLEQQLAEVCVDTCEKASAKKMYSPTCVLAAKTRAELSDCGVRCTVP